MLTEQLIEELTKELSLKRLWHSGLFIRLPIVHEELSSEITLFRAVLDRALLDLFHHDAVIRDDAKTWLDLKNEDFLESCDRADLDHLLVYELFTTINKIFKNRINEIPRNLQ